VKPRLLSGLALLMMPAAMFMMRAQSTEGSNTMPYKDARLPVEQRVQDLLHRMTLEEKASMLSGSGWMESQPIPRLGIPAIKMADGPMGVRAWYGSSALTSGAALPPIYSTAFPSGIMMASTWNPELLTREGQAIGQEVRALGRDQILGPTVNIARVPLWGRNFEGYGEDPYLAARMGVAYIKGVQGEGVIATVKHFVANNQEFERHRIDETISERALHEIYMPAFRAAVQEAGVWSVMSAYNKVNGRYCAESPELLQDVLRKQWGFTGFVVSDWGSTYSTAGTVNAGMDLEMPGGAPMRAWLARPSTQKDGNGAGWLTQEKVLADVKAGKITAATLDQNVSRILRVIFASGLFDRKDQPTGEVDTAAQRAIAREAATQGIVLLKNAGNLLPLDPSKVHSIAVIGPEAAVARTGGGGSSLVRPKSAVTPLEGIQERAGSQISVTHSDDASAAARADVAIVVVGYDPKTESEGFDRQSLDLPAGQDELIQAVAKANRNAIVVINAGAPVAMEKWLDQTPAVLDMWYPGEEGGHALAAIVFGDANPSGKLPVTFPKSMKDTPANGHYPGENLHVTYAEGIYVGYRHFDKAKIEPLFPFGYGLSYTRFDYSDLNVEPGNPQTDPAQVTVRVRNMGSRAGAEVVQLYVHDVHSTVDRPVKELKGFQRVMLEPGEAQVVRFNLDRPAFSYYSVAKKTWVAEPGTYEVLVGGSSRDIRLKSNFDLAK
jgi:beta-glucosidase